MTDANETEPQSSQDRKGPPSAFIPKNKKAAERERQKNKGLDRRKKDEASKQPTVIVYDEHKGITAYDRYGWKCWGTDVRPSSDKWFEATPIASEFTDNGVITCAYETNIFGINSYDGSIVWKNELLERGDETLKSVFQNEKYALILTERIWGFKEQNSRRQVTALRLADGKKCWNATDLSDVMAVTENYAVLSKNGGRTAEMVSLKSGKKIGKTNFGNDPPTAFCAEGRTVAYAPMVNAKHPFDACAKVPAKTFVLDESGKTQGTAVEDKKGGTINLLSISTDAGLLATATHYRDEKRRFDNEKDEYVITVYSKKDDAKHGKEYSRVWKKQATGPILDLKFDPKNEHLIATTRLTHDSLSRYLNKYTADLITSYDPCRGKKQWEHRYNERYIHIGPENAESRKTECSELMNFSYDGLIYVGSGALGVCALDINNGRQVEQIRVEPAVKKQGELRYKMTNVKGIAVRKNYTAYSGGASGG